MMKSVYNVINMMFIMNCNCVKMSRPAPNPTPVFGATAENVGGEFRPESENEHQKRIARSNIVRPLARGVSLLSARAL